MNMYQAMLRDLKKEKTTLNLRIKTVERWLGIKHTKNSNKRGPYIKKRRRLTEAQKKNLSKAMKARWAAKKNGE